MIPVNEPLLMGNELKYVTECITTGWISSAGRFIDEFEARWASYCGMKHGIAVSNGTVALELAVEVNQFPPGSEIILPSFTIISCALAIVKCGLKPVLVDCDPATWCMNPEQIVARVNERTVAVMPVHIYGHPVDMDRVREIARQRGLVIVEDAAEAHGAEVLLDRQGPNAHWQRCGSLGDLSIFSFFANKIISTGEGGMVLTNSDTLAERCRSSRNLCFLPRQRFLHEELGHNFRLTNLQAALGLAQLEQIDAIIARKQDMAARYRRGLQGLQLELPVEESWARNVYWMYGVVLPEAVPLDAREFATRLRAMGIDTRPFFLGMHEQPVFQRMGLFLNERYPLTERISRRGLYLPSGQAISDGQIDEVCLAVRTVLESL